MPFYKTKSGYIAILLVVALALRFGLFRFLGNGYSFWFRIASVVLVLGIGAIFVLRSTAKIIEETTGILSKKTKLASGLLQSLGTAFPDMVLGIIAAIISLRLRSIDYARAINYAIIAAATTFGSNIYNILHAAWCVFRQNLANRKNKIITMIPLLKAGGFLKPVNQHSAKPTLPEIDSAIDVSNALTMLTAIVALGMVIFGSIRNIPGNMQGDLYQLIRPVGIVVFVLAILVLYRFRKSKRQENDQAELNEGELYYQKRSNWLIFLHLLLAAVAILLAAESMVHAIEVLCELTGIPFVIAGVLAGLIGCLGEILVVHNFSVNPQGRIGDAITGVAMDNVVTIMGAAIVAIMGGIFLGGNALILIFVVILTSNNLLIWQISKLKNYFLNT